MSILTVTLSQKSKYHQILHWICNTRFNIIAIKKYIAIKYAIVVLSDREVKFGNFELNETSTIRVFEYGNEIIVEYYNYNKLIGYIVFTDTNAIPYMKPYWVDNTIITQNDISAINNITDQWKNLKKI